MKKSAYVFCILILIIALLSIGYRHRQQRVCYTPYIVQGKETLWDIADRVPGDPRKWVDVMEKLNKIKPQNLRAGMRIMVPTIRK